MLELDKVRTKALGKIPSSDIADFLSIASCTNGQKFNQVQFPVEWITTNRMIDHLCQLPLGQFYKTIGACDEPPETIPDARFEIPTFKSACAVILAVMISAAARSNPKRCTRSTITKEKSTTYGLPLAIPGSDRIPAPLRLTPTPCSNFDYDVVNWFFTTNARALLSALPRLGIKTNIKPCCDDKHDESICSANTIDLAVQGDRVYTKYLIFMAIVLRMTGDVAHLATFGTYVAKHGVDGQHNDLAQLNLPIPDTIDLFIQFMRSFPSSSFRTFLSGQHSNMIPTVFKSTSLDGIRNFEVFLNDFANKEGHGGFARLEMILLNGGSNGLDRARTVSYLCKEVAQSARSKNDNDLKWIVHRALADVDSVLPGIFGEVTYDSLGFGFGSEFGLRVLARNCAGDRRHRFEWIHTQLIQAIKALDKTELFILGYYLDENNDLRSRLGKRRLYSMSDTEHILCKIYICAALVHPSRTCSESKELTSPHCWPIPGSYDWLDFITNDFEAIWGKFLETNLPCLEEHFPTDFNYQDAYYVEAICTGHDGVKFAEV